MQKRRLRAPSIAADVSTHQKAMRSRDASCDGRRSFSAKKIGFDNRFFGFRKQIEAVSKLILSGPHYRLVRRKAAGFSAVKGVVEVFECPVLPPKPIPASLMPPHPLAKSKLKPC